MEEVQVGRRAAKQTIGVRQTRGIVLGGVDRDGAGGLDRALDGFARQVRGARVAAALAEVHGDAQALVAVVLDGLDLPAAHGDRLPDRRGHFDLGIARAPLPCVVEG